MTRTSPGVGRVVAVLNFFASHPGQAFTLTDLVRALKLSRATCHALLASLVEAGYLYRTSDKSYVIGPALVNIGRVAGEQFSPLRVAQPEIRALADEFDATCAVVFRDGDYAVVRDRAASFSQLRNTVDVGARLALRPPFAAIFYAWRPLVEAQQWLDKLTPPATDEQRASMFNGMAFAQANGYSFGVRNARVKFDEMAPEDVFRSGRREYPVSVETVLEPNKAYELAFLIAPVFDAQQNIEMVLTLVGFSTPKPGSEVKRIARRLCDVCGRIGVFMTGAKPPADLGRV